jgi:UDP-N-acetylglucosamine 1-carboxyvinyltransferase
MEKLRIEGGVALNGEVQASGAKNAITKLLVASLLSDKPCTFYNVPNIGDVRVTVELCQEIGMQVEWDKKAGVLHCQTKDIKTAYIPQRFSGSNRIPILMIGALLGRTEEDVIVPTVGGCKIGRRSVDFHVEALTKLGACVELREMKRECAYFAHAHNGLKGTLIRLPYPSIGATENTILASVSAKGTTILQNAAIEPEVMELILFLQKIGAQISVETDRTIRIVGTRLFYETAHTVLPDRIEAASFGMAAVGTKGRIFVKGAQHATMMTFLNKLRELGGGFTVKKDGIEFFYDGPLQGSLHLETDVHPGFMTDWQPPFTVLLTQATGASIVHETVYENRFGFTSALRDMGADVSLFKQCLGQKPCRFSSCSYYHSAVIKGPTPFVGKAVTIPDLRAGFAYVMAGLIASGTTTISGVYFIDRGYENLVEKLQSVGAHCERIVEEDAPATQQPIVVQC